MDINFANLSDLNRTVTAAFQNAFSQAPEPEYGAIATTIRSGSSSNLYPFLHDTDGMREWLGDAIFDQLASGRYAIDNRKFQKGMTADRDQMLDDAEGGAGIYSSLAEIVARACASHPDELVIAETLANAETLLCHDGQPFFDDSHPNQNKDGGTQDNLIAGGGTPWYLFDTTKPIKPLIYQLREKLTFAMQTRVEDSDFTFTKHKYRWNAWMRDAAGFGVWWTGIKSYATLDEAGFVDARDKLESFHMGIKDPLTGSYRSARNRATLLMVPRSLQDTAKKLIGQEKLASGEDNYIRNAINIHVSNYL